MDFNKELQRVSDKVIAEQLPSIIEKQITETLTGIVRDTFCEYSDFGNKLKEVISKKANVSLEECKLIDYSSLITSTVEKEILGAQMKAIEPMVDNIRSVVGFIEKESISISELVDMYKSEVSENSCEESGEITFKCLKSEQYDWYDIAFSDDEGVELRSCNIEFTVHKNGRVYKFRVKDYFGSDHSNNPSAISKFSKFELYLLRLINSGIKFEIDETDFDLEWNKYE